MYRVILDFTTTANAMQIRSGGVGSFNLDSPSFPQDDHGYMIDYAEGANYGADLTTDGTYIYMTIGDMYPTMFRYNPELGTWKQLADAPHTFYF